MSDFKAKMHSISAGALPQTPLGELTALPRPLNWEPTSKRRQGTDGREKGVRLEIALIKLIFLLSSSVSCVYSIYSPRRQTIRKTKTYNGNIHKTHKLKYRG